MRLTSPRLVLRSSLFLASAAALISSAPATSLRPLNLQELVRHSSRIFQGRCLSQHQGADERGLPYTAYTFRVEEVWAGKVRPETVTIRQFGLPAEAPLEAARNQIRIAAMPHYQPGRRYLLFLPQDSRWGFASPVGLLQGAFHVLGEGPQRVAVNGVGNLNLTLDTAKTPSQRLQDLSSRSVGRAAQGPVTYESLRQVVQRLASGEQMAASEMARALRPGGRR